jgi:signal transduction histidine kinase
MKNLGKKYQAWSDKVQAQSLEKLPPAERADVMAFNAVWAANWPRYLWIAAAIWVVAALTTKIAIESLGWVESFAVTFLILGCAAVTFFSVWFGNYKIKFSRKSIGIFVGFATVITFLAPVGGYAFGRYLKGGLSSLQDFVDFAPKIFASSLITLSIFCAFVVLIMFARRKQLELLNAELTREAIEANLARQLADARLRLMQAQVEPHFLFNTLASVQHLAEPQSPEAANLTRELITFLRAGLGGLRDKTTTLKREFEMAAAYLAIMQTRMGKRLTFTLDLPLDLADENVPPAMLISLVENAIKHGLEPATEGGSVHVFAVKNNDMIQFGVSDTGLGMTNMASIGAADGGLGLANVRERLQAIFGDDAQLTIEESQPRGVSAVIKIKHPTIK